MTSCDLSWPELTRKWRHLNGSPLEVDVEGLWLRFCVCFSSYSTVTRRRWWQRDRKWRPATSRDQKWPEVTSFDQKSPGSGDRRPISQVYDGFYLLQGCNSQKVAVTWHEMTSRDFMWPEVTRKWRPLSGSRLEVAVKAYKSNFRDVWAPTEL